MSRASRAIEHPDGLKAKASREGDAYHEVWAARRCLRLLDGKSGLSAITIEGATEKPTTMAAAEGFLKVDMTEYFDGRSFKDASRVVYVQLKYSPLRSKLPIQTSELADTLAILSAGDPYLLTDRNDRLWLGRILSEPEPAIFSEHASMVVKRKKEKMS